MKTDIHILLQGTTDSMEFECPLKYCTSNTAIVYAARLAWIHRHSIIINVHKITGNPQKIPNIQCTSVSNSTFITSSVFT